MRYKLLIFVTIAQGIRPCGAFIFLILVKSQFWGFYTLIVAPMGVKFGTEDWTPIGASKSASE